MPQHLLVDPPALRASVAAVADARAALADAGAALEQAGAGVDRGIDHSREADDKVRTFVRQWRSEYDLIAELLGAYTDVIDAAAASYEEGDAAVAAEINRLGG